MQAHHWVNFAKSYGSYLIGNCLTGHERSAVAAHTLLEIVRMCLASSISEEHISILRKRISDLAEDFDALFPETQKSLVLHLLCFHMPDTIEYWGPARGYWCFPFERSVL